MQQVDERKMGADRAEHHRSVLLTVALLPLLLSWFNSGTLPPGPV